MNDKVIFIVGPTAAGKTGVAIELAGEIKGEIISADSMQVYKGMPVLTGAPKKNESGKIPYHLIAELPPLEEYSAACFSGKAKSLIEDIIGREKIPIITGGTGLYVKALIDGLFPSPEKDLNLRKHLESKVREAGVLSLHNELKELDPESAENIHPNDVRRVIRALEVYYKTGSSLTTHKSHTKGIKDKYDILECGISVPREELYERINERVDRMFADGIVDEVKRLLKNKLSMTAGKAIGVNEIKGYLDGAYSLNTAKELIKKNTRRYAKRQFTWFKADKKIRWFRDGKGIISYCRSWV